MRFLVLGVGSIGCRHIRNLQSMGYSCIKAYDTDLAALKARSRALGVGYIRDPEPDWSSFDAVIVCSPPSAHVNAVIAAVRKGKYVLVEKPISNTLSDAQRLVAYEDKIMVGYNVRYHPMVSYIKQVLPSLGKLFNVQMEFAYSLEHARPGTDYRKGYYAREGEGGVLLDHIHELDYAHYLFGRFANVYCTAAKVSGLEIGSEDNANLILGNSQGFSLTLHIDYLQRRYARNIKIIAENGVLIGDYADGSVTFMLDGEEEVIERFHNSFDQTYIDEMEDFVAIVKGFKPPAITVTSALHSLELSEAARESNRTGRVVSI